MLKMRLRDLSYSALKEIVMIYDQTVGGCGLLYFGEHSFESYVMPRLRREESVEYRYGSRITRHSKLWIIPERVGGEELVSFRFDPNTAAGENDALAKKLGKKFEKAVDDFLKKKKLAMEGGE